jgi:hypothetical protein
MLTHSITFQKRRPIIFIGHSLGGLVIKDVCLLLLYFSHAWPYYLHYTDTYEHRPIGAFQVQRISFQQQESTDGFHHHINIWNRLPRDAPSRWEPDSLGENCNQPCDGGL